MQKKTLALATSTLLLITLLGGCYRDGDSGRYNHMDGNNGAGKCGNSSREDNDGRGCKMQNGDGGCNRAEDGTCPYQEANPAVPATTGEPASTTTTTTPAPVAPKQTLPATTQTPTKTTAE